MRRLMLAAFLFMAGSGMLLTGALASAAVAADTVTVTNPGNQTSVTSKAITPLQIHAVDSAGVGLAFSATGLPAGLVISAAGLISGTPTVLGTHYVTVTATEVTATASPTASPSASMSASASPSASASATKPATASAVVTAFGTASFTWTITATVMATPTPTPTVTHTAMATPTVPPATPVAVPSAGVMPVGAVGTGGGGSLGGGDSAALTATGILFILAAAGLGVLTWRRSRGAHLS